MADAIIGTPSIVGFSNGIRDDGLGLGVAAMLLQQNLSRDHADISRDVQQTTHQVEESVEDNAMAISIAIEKIGAANELATEKTGAANILAIAGVQLEMAKIAGIAALTAANNTAAIQASIAECCCSTKSLIIEKSSATDALIRQLDADNAKQQLQDAKNELLAIKYSNSATAAQ